MIVQLTGDVIQASTTSFVMDCGGVGYGAHCTPATAAALRVGQRSTVYTSLVVREDSQTLYGFATPSERDAFELVQSASGVGPRIALAMVSVLPVAELQAAIVQEDAARLMTVPGIGKKSAQRLILELKDKVVALAGDEVPAAPIISDEAWKEAVLEGLQSLGWNAKEASRGVAAVADEFEHPEEQPLGTLMRVALNSLARR